MPLKFLTWILTTLAATALLVGCIDDIPAEDDDFSEDAEKPVGNVFVRLHLGLSDNSSRADGDTPAAGETPGSGSGESETPGSGTGDTPAETPTGPSLNIGSSQEFAINSVDIYVCDAESGELLDYVPLSEEEVAAVRNDGGFAEIPIFVQEGRKVHIYAAANFLYNMRACFVKGQKADDIIIKAPAKTYTDNDYYKVYPDVLNYFVPGSDGIQQTLQNTANNKMVGDESYIPMTGMFKTLPSGNTASTADIIINRSEMTSADPLDIKAYLTRIVAKVHVLATVALHTTITTGEVVDYIATAGSRYEAVPIENSQTPDTDKDYAGWLGWIRLNNVKYMPNSVNKSTYLFQQKNNTTKALPLSEWKDPNMDLMPYTARINDNDIDFKIDDCQNDFTYYEGRDLHSANDVHYSMSSAEEYDLNKLNNTKDSTRTDNNRYVSGMYCLENYFDTPPQAQSFAESPDIIPAVTHVSVAAKLTPRVIIIMSNFMAAMDALVGEYKNLTTFQQKYNCSSEDFTQDDVDAWDEIKKNTAYAKYLDPTNTTYVYRSFRTFMANTETDAAYILKWSLFANKLWSTDPDDYKNDKYTYGTFYAYDRSFDNVFDVINNPLIHGHRYLFLTAGVVKNAGDYVTLKTNSVLHPGGWCYYYAYIDNNQKVNNGVTPYHSSQVTRNTYYLLNITNFGSPGGSVSDPENIKVNTEVVKWDYEAAGNIELH